ncbi:MAG TPA: asparagine synthase (glutamine-hydrolyzing) [Pyrinomonadaceae bacterium]|nr:asparagine synthase (glutamine-hydrolyzing) [Pyrinomonadaceae bacterium]
MCGIVGIVGPQETSWLTRMNQVLTYRGPDDAGEYRDDSAHVALAMRRLSILDLASGHQPMANADETIWIVFNGEIYNSPEIRQRLLKAGHSFKTANSDTEVLLHLYEEKDAAMLDELNGMFAFVIYDQRRKRLFGARDRIGIKPLYFLDQPGLFAFASELKSLLTLPIANRELDFQSIYHYMTLLFVPGDRTIFSGIRRLPPGHLFNYDLGSGELSVRRYWQLTTDKVEENRSEKEWSEIIRHELSEAVRRWMLSDVPVGCSLSGGLDSSAVVALVSELGYGPIRTYSLGFAAEDEAAWNELELARKVADRFHTVHREIILEPEDLLNDLMKMVWHLDEPYGGGLPSWYVFRTMSEEVKVGLTGTGGDELFGNYGKFSPFEISPVLRLAANHPGLVRAGANLPSLVWTGWHRLVASMPASVLSTRRKDRLMQLDRICRAPFGSHYYATQTYLSDELKNESVFNGKFSELEETASYLQRLFREAGTKNVRDAVAYVDFQTQLPEEFLMMTDRFSMAHSLEARVPFLDHQFVETVFRIPASVRTRPHDLKYLLKAAVGELLPKELLGAPKKGFVIPITLWLRNQLRPLAERLLSTERLQKQGIFRPSFFASYVAPHIEGRADFTWQVWAALMFQLWHSVFVEQTDITNPAHSWRDLI